MVSGYLFSAGSDNEAVQDPRTGEGVDREKIAPRPSPNPERPLDGFVVPEQMKQDKANPLLAEYVRNDCRIRELCSSPVERTFFGLVVDDEDRSSKEQEALILMARNYALIEQLSGRETVLPGRKAEKKTIGDVLGSRFADTIAAGKPRISLRP